MRYIIENTKTAEALRYLQDARSLSDLKARVQDVQAEFGDEASVKRSAKLYTLDDVTAPNGFAIQWDETSIDPNDFDAEAQIEMDIQAEDGIADLASQDLAAGNDEQTVESWYRSAAQAGDMAVCRMIDWANMRDLNGGAQAIYDAAHKEYSEEDDYDEASTHQAEAKSKRIPYGNQEYEVALQSDGNFDVSLQRDGVLETVAWGTWDGNRAESTADLGEDLWGEVEMALMDLEDDREASTKRSAETVRGFDVDAIVNEVKSYIDPNDPTTWEDYMGDDDRVELLLDTITPGSAGIYQPEEAADYFGIELTPEDIEYDSGWEAIEEHAAKVADQLTVAVQAKGLPGYMYFSHSDGFGDYGLMYGDSADDHQ